MSKKRRPFRLGDLSRKDREELRNAVANQPPAPSAPPDTSATTETAEISAEVPAVEATPEIPGMEVKAEISVTTPKTSVKNVSGKKKATKKKPATPKAAKKKSAKKSKPADASPTAPDTKKDEAKVSVDKLPDRPEKPSAEELRRQERPFEELWKDDPDPADEFRRRRKTDKKVGADVGVDQLSGGSGSVGNVNVANEGNGNSRNDGGQNNWIPLAILGAVAILLTLFLIGVMGGLSFSIHQFTAQQCCEEGNEAPPMTIENNCQVIVEEEATKAEVVQPPIRRATPPTPRTCKVDTLYMRDGKDY